MLRLFVGMALSMLAVLVLFGCGGPDSTPTPVPTATPAATATPRPTDTPPPSPTPRNTDTPRPTNTPLPTATPVPPSPTPAPPPIDVKVTKKTYIKADYATNGLFTDEIQIDMNVTNNSDKTVAAFQGELIFSDLFDAPFFRGGLKYDDPESLIPRHTTPWTRYFQYNQFETSSQELATAPLEKLKVAWKLTGVAYSDGTTQTFP